MKTRLALLIVLLSLAASAQTYTETILHSFGSSPIDGINPAGDLVLDSAGNLYGTTHFGGTGGAGGSSCGFPACGTVFKLTPQGKETILHNFNGSDGNEPYSALVIDKAGNLYGVTPFGGVLAGVAFKITAAGKFSILHQFGRTPTDGYAPNGPLTLDSAGNLYGTTPFGGQIGGGCGTIFKLNPKGVETILHRFTGTDGCNPNANLLRDAAGNLYGAAGMGGAYNHGVIFKLDASNVETVLYNFCPDQTVCSDGAYPSYLARNAQGNFFGTTQGGVFEFSTKGAESVIVNFTGPNGIPPGGPLLISGGNIYGTNMFGGVFEMGDAAGGGVVYQLTPSGIETILRSFPDPTNPGTEVEGWYPTGGIIQDAAGNLYGTTQGGGAFNQNGTVFKLTKD
jgi:uncharacterized repeat protein (TIGR03803 family)